MRFSLMPIADKLKFYPVLIISVFNFLYYFVSLNISIICCFVTVKLHQAGMTMTENFISAFENGHEKLLHSVSHRQTSCFPLLCNVTDGKRMTH